MFIIIAISLILVFILGILKLQQNRNLVWLQIHYLQSISCLALINTRLPLNLLNLLLGLSSLIRLDFISTNLSPYHPFFPDLSLQDDKLGQFDRFERFGYYNNTWDHIVNLLILLGLLFVLILLFNFFGYAAKNSKFENMVKYITAIFTFQIYDRFF